MARRSRRRRRDRPTLILLPGFLLVGIALIQVVVAEVRSHPVGTVFLALGAGGFSLFWGRRRWLRRSHRLRIQAIRAQEIETYHQMNGKEFERALAYLCGRDGCSDVRVAGGAGDLGADVVAMTPQGGRLVIQAKRYRFGNRVSGPDLQKFGGTCFAVHGAEVAVVVTTSDFTRQAMDYAQHIGIRLFDNEALAAWASRTGPAPWVL